MKHQDRKPRNMFRTALLMLPIATVVLTNIHGSVEGLQKTEIINFGFPITYMQRTPSFGFSEIAWVFRRKWELATPSLEYGFAFFRYIVDVLFLAGLVWCVLKRLRRPSPRRIGIFDYLVGTGIVAVAMAFDTQLSGLHIFPAVGELMSRLLSWLIAAGNALAIWLLFTCVLNYFK